MLTEMANCGECNAEVNEDELDEHGLCGDCEGDRCEECGDSSQGTNYDGLCGDCAHEAEQNKPLDHEAQDLLNRVNAAFAAVLHEHKIVGVTDWCCGGCSASAGGSRAQEIEGLGYTYYHQQDVDSLRDGSDYLLVGYGRADGGEGAEEIGEIVAAALRASGCSVHWAGDSATRLRVT